MKTFGRPFSFIMLGCVLGVIATVAFGYLFLQYVIIPLSGGG